MSTRVPPFVTVLIAVSVAGFGFGVVLPVTSVILENMHVATPVTGLMATVMFAGLALGAPLVGRSIECYGLRPTLTAGLSITGLSMFLLSFGVSLPAWFLFRFIMGVGFGAIFTSCETLINRVSTEQNRGRNLGLYGFAFSLALMAGPVGLWLLKFGTWLPFTTAGVLSFVGAAAAFTTIPSLQEHTPDLQFNRAFLKRLRVSLTAMIMCGFMEGALIALIPIYTLRRGFDEVQTGILLFAFMLGHGGLTPLIGMLGDRIGLRNMIKLTYGLGSFSFLLVLCIPDSMWLTALLLLGGASVGALYPLGVGLLAEVVSPEELARGNALTTFCYGLGSIIGPLFPAVIMHITVPASLFVVAAGLYVCILMTMLKKD